MTASDWLETACLLLILAAPFTVGWIVSLLDDRRKRQGRQQRERPMSPTEFYVFREARKHEVRRHLRAVARQHGRPANRQRRNHPNNTPWR